MPARWGRNTHANCARVCGAVGSPKQPDSPPNCPPTATHLETKQLRGQQRQPALACCRHACKVAELQAGRQERTRGRATSHFMRK